MRRWKHMREEAGSRSMEHTCIDAYPQKRGSRCGFSLGWVCFSHVDVLMMWVKNDVMAPNQWAYPKGACPCHRGWVQT